MALVIAGPVAEVCGVRRLLLIGAGGKFLIAFTRRLTPAIHHIEDALEGEQSDGPSVALT